MNTCTFQILFTSDVHGAFRDYSYSLDKETPASGFSKAATLMRRERDNFNGTTFVVDVGDIIQGNGTNACINNDAFKPYPLLAAYEAFGYDIVSVGNHEFNYGIPAMLKAFEGYHGDKLCGNIFDNNEQLLPGFSAYVVKTLENGPRIAFIGMVSPNADKWDKANFEKAGYHSSSAAAETRSIIDRLKAEDAADIFILLGHMHEDNELDRDGSGANDVIKMNADIDLFLGAHFHLAVGTKDAQRVLNNAVKFAENKSAAATYGKVLITATCDNGRWRVINKTGAYAESDVKTDIIDVTSETDNDPAVLAVTDTAHTFLVDYMRNTVVGYLKGGPLVPPPLIKGTHEVILSPTALITLLTDVMKAYSQADVVAAAVNDFNVNCAEGPITMGGVAQMYVYDNNTIYRMCMTGRQLLKWMEWSYAYFGETKDGVPNLTGSAVNPDTDLTIPYGTRKVYMHDKFGGLDYTVDLTKKTGERVRILRMADGSAFHPDKCYTVAAPNYRATTNLLINTKDGIFKEGEPTATLLDMDMRSPGGHINMLDWIIEYIKDQPEQTITNAFRPNWSFVNLNWEEPLRTTAIAKINDGLIPYDIKAPVRKKTYI